MDQWNKHHCKWINGINITANGNGSMDHGNITANGSMDQWNKHHITVNGSME